MLGNEIIIPATIPELIDIYQEQTTKIENAFNMLSEAEQVLKHAFGDTGGFCTMPSYYNPANALEKAKLNMHKAAWARFVEKSEIRKILSVKEATALDSRLNKGDDLPPITIDNVMEMFSLFVAKGSDLATDAVKEVFDFLKPNQNGYSKEYKTNKRYCVGKKVIMTWIVSKSYLNGVRFKVNYQREDKITALDRIFHMLDGKGIPRGYKSPLIDAINTSHSGLGETDYFKFSCYENGNLHITFKRLDLLKELNRIGGNGTLKGKEN